MALAAVVAVIVVLAIVIAAAVYWCRGGPKPPPCPVATGYWVIRDNDKVATTLACPPGSALAVQYAQYGVPWGNCPWVDIAPQVRKAADGQGSYSILLDSNYMKNIGVTDPCFGLVKLYTGTYDCMPAAPAGAQQSKI